MKKDKELSNIIKADFESQKLPHDLTNRIMENVEQSRVTKLTPILSKRTWLIISLIFIGVITGITTLFFNTYSVEKFNWNWSGHFLKLPFIGIIVAGFFVGLDLFLRKRKGSIV